MARVRAVVAAGAVLLALPVPSSAATRPALAGTTVLTGTRSAAIRVRLARPATVVNPLLVDGAARDLAITTAGRYAGFALVQETRDELRQVVLVGGVLPDGSGRTFVHAANGRRGAGAFALAAGDYTLHLVTDGRPATVRLRLRGLAGTTRLAPRSATGVVAGFPAPMVDPEPARVTYAGGGDRRVAGRTLFFSVFYAGYAAHLDTVYTSCFYYRRPAGPAPYAPGCPDPAAKHVTPISLPPSTGHAAEHVLLGSVLPLREGHFAAGTSLVSATPASEVAYVQLWLPY